MANTVFVSDETVQQVLDWKEMVDALRAAHAADLHPDFAPPRTMARGKTGEWTRALCAVPDGPIMGTKFFALAAKGGGIRYCIALFRKTDSELVALVDANTVTARRTAGATAVALDKLAPRKPLSLGILGAGHEASAHVNAVGTTRTFTSIKVFSPTQANREAFAEKFSKQLGIPCRAVGSAREAVEGVDLVIGATSTRGGEPSLKGEYLSKGQCIGAIGSTLPEQWECDPPAMAAADLIVCDNAEEVQHGTGDFIEAAKAGVKFDGKVFDLPDLVKGKLDEKVKAAGITMYRSAGTGLQDVVVAELAWRRATEKGLTVELPMQLFHKGARSRVPAPAAQPASATSK
jgi:ornithine cyclodeaminase/alanine dehydrogenase